jgi:N-acetyl-gamma-glutamylphosphate reductase
MHRAEALLDGGAKVVDLAADFRLEDLDQWQQ